MTTCAYHPDRETALSCTRCDRSACPDCLAHVAVGQHCVGCREGRPEAGGKGLNTFRLKKAVVGVDEKGRLKRPGLMFFGLVGLFVLSCIGAALVGRPPFEPELASDAAKVAAVAVVISGAVLGLVFHEWAHAAVAYRGGDRTVLDKGYLTMDVRDYSNPLMSLGMPMLFLAIGGLPLPGGAVWINTNLLRSKWWITAVSLAGPAINVVGALAIYGLVTTGVFGEHYVLSSALMFLAYLEIGIALLNLIPFPGLDGYGAIEPHLPDSVAGFLAPLRQVTFIVLMVLFLNGDALRFIWDGAELITGAVGVDGLYDYLISYGEHLARPNLW